MTETGAPTMKSEAHAEFVAPDLRRSRALALLLRSHA
jgi:hypothetical protein